MPNREAGREGFIGFAKLRPGKIHLYCPGCKRKQSNTPRYSHDPKLAVLAHLFCPKCANGGKDNDTHYLTVKGRHMTFDGRRWR